MLDSGNSSNFFFKYGYFWHKKNLLWHQKSESKNKTKYKQKPIKNFLFFFLPVAAR